MYNPILYDLLDHLNQVVYMKGVTFENDIKINAFLCSAACIFNLIEGYLFIYSILLILYVPYLMYCIIIIHCNALKRDRSQIMPSAEGY